MWQYPDRSVPFASSVAMSTLKSSPFLGRFACIDIFYNVIYKYVTYNNVKFGFTDEGGCIVTETSEFIVKRWTSAYQRIMIFFNVNFSGRGSYVEIYVKDKQQNVSEQNM